MRLLACRGFDAAIFDFDHTLVELGRWVDWGGAVEKIFELYRQAGVEVDGLGARFGFSMVRELDRRLSLVDLVLAARVRAEAYEALAVEEERGASRSELMPGARPALEALERLGSKLAIVSANSARAIRLSLRRFQLEERFSVIVGRTPNMPLKPDPAMFRYCTDCLSVAPEKVLAVGDSSADIRPAVSLGMLAVGVASGEAASARLRGAGAALVVGGLNQLAVLLTRDAGSWSSEKLD